MRRWNEEPVELTWAELEGAIAVRLALQLGMHHALHREIADLVKTRLSRITSYVYLFHTRDIAHFKRGKPGRWTAGSNSRIWLKKPRTSFNESFDEGVKILPHVFNERRFAVEREYNLDQLVEEALEMLTTPVEV